MSLEIVEYKLRAPFEIRAHHALNSGFFGWRASRSALIKDNEKAVKQWANMRNLPIDNPDHKYSIDLFGNEPTNHVPKFTANLISYLGEFYDLDDSDPVHLITGKDRICSSCAIGAHCEESPVATQKLTHEEQSIMTFVSVALRSGFEYWNDFYPVYLPFGRIIRLETNKKTVVEVADSYEDYAHNYLKKL